MRLHIRLAEGDPQEIVLARSSKAATLWLDGKPHQATLRPVGRGYEVALDDRVERIWLVVDHDTVHVHALGRPWRLEVFDPVDLALQGAEQADTATAPMPGVMQKVAVAPGDAVHTGQTLVVIESMKMQSEIVAWRDGVVERVHIGLGETFDRGAPLVALVSEEAEDE
jgi:3-methylcrotonyl-CoA carboxylase alpha subunit